MAWHQQYNKRYYYRNRWINGRSVRQYVGQGPAGELAAATDALRRENRQAQATAWRQEQARCAPPFALVRQLCDVTETMLRGALLVAGYHRHARFSWRRRRVPKE
jgi:hypothetical protein